MQRLGHQGVYEEIKMKICVGGINRYFTIIYYLRICKWRNYGNFLRGTSSKTKSYISELSNIDFFNFESNIENHNRVSSITSTDPRPWANPQPRMPIKLF